MIASFRAGPSSDVQSPDVGFSYVVWQQIFEKYATFANLCVSNVKQHDDSAKFIFCFRLMSIINEPFELHM
jgi:hypothetical protein